MREINKFISYMRDIDRDGTLNEQEIFQFKNWVDHNRNMVTVDQENKLIIMCDEMIDSGVVSDKEREEMIELAENEYENMEERIVTYLYDLKFILNRIFCNDEFVEEHFNDMQNWMFLYNNIRNIHFARLYKKLNDLRDKKKDGSLCKNDIDRVVDMVLLMIKNLQFKSKLDLLKRKVRRKENIGIDLIELLDNEDVITSIHREAEKQLILNFTKEDRHDSMEIIYISLVLIGLFEYDSNFYNGVEKTYSKLYEYRSQGAIESKIRKICEKFQSEKYMGKRKINTALRNAIVPVKFLPDFFDFIYDIYKTNLDYNLPESPYEEFQFVFEALRNSMKMDSDIIELNVIQKTYKLIKTTKELIMHDTDVIIKLSIIIARLIDNKMCNITNKIYNPYLKYGFEEWEKNIEKRNEKKKSTTIFSRWEPEYKLVGRDIYIIPPVHKIKESYDYRDVKISIYEDSEIIYTEERPDIRNIIGGYKVIPQSIKLDNPLSNPRYVITAGEKIIYDSKEELYRDVIVFDEKGNEIKNNTDYKGTAVFCTEEKHEKLNAFYKTDSYILAENSVEYSDVYTFGETVFGFSALVKPGIFGEKYNDNFIREKNTDKLIPIYKEVNYLMFESSIDETPETLFINNREYKLDEFNITVTDRGTIRKHVIDLELKKADMYKIRIPRISTFEFAYDPDLQIDKEKISENYYKVYVMTELSDEFINQDINLDTFEEFNLKFLNRGREFTFVIDFNISIYKLSGMKWNPITESIWIDDIKSDSYIDFLGVDFDKVCILTDNGELVSENEKIEKNGIINRFKIGHILSYRNNNNYIQMVLIKDNKAVEGLRCYMHCVIDDAETDFSFDSVNSKIVVKAEYFGRREVYFKIKGNNGYCSDNIYIENKDTKEIDIPESFVEYTCVFFEKSKGLSLVGDTVIKEMKCLAYAYKDFVGRYFKINTACLLNYSSGISKHEEIPFDTTFVYIKEQVAETEFIGEIYVCAYTNTFPLIYINPVLVELYEESIDNTIDMYMSKDGDGLLIDREHNGILNSIDDYNAADIYIYTVDLKGEKHL